MATPKWEPGKLYPPGSLVVPRTALPPGNVPITNGGFESGDLTGWTYTTVGGTATASVEAAHPRQGVYAFFWPGAAGTGSEGGTECIVTSEDARPVTEGLLVTTSGWFKYNTTGDIDGSRAQMRIQWYDAAMNPIHVTQGNLIRGSGNNNEYKQSTASGRAPAGAAFVAAQFWVTGRGGKGHVYADNISWNYVGATAPEGLVYRAVQPETGYSDTTEPNWPPTTGVQVVDNEVIWEGVIASRVVWQASPILKSGDTEPVWPIAVGDAVADGTISWQVVSRRIEDPNCPKSKVVTILASKVFAGDDDIVRYSATVNPKDWSSEQDAGYLPTGLQQFGSNPVAAMGPYRSNLVPFNAEGFQMWQADEDPQNMALQDAMPIGSTRHHALCPVGNDLLFLSSQGVRSIGIAGGSSNLQGGDVGMPIDVLVNEAIAAADAGGYQVLSLYYLAEGEYWLIVNNATGSQAFVYAMTRTGQVGAWSRYLFPFQIDDWAILGDVLYLRSGDSIYRMDENAVGGDVLTEGGVPVPFEGVIWWPWLDLGAPGVTKTLIGFDVVGEGAPAIEFGYDQASEGLFTTPFTVPEDTVPGMVIPMPLAAPSLSVRLTFDGSTPWHFRALNLYLQDNRPTS